MRLICRRRAAVIALIAGLAVLAGCQPGRTLPLNPGASEAPGVIQPNAAHNSPAYPCSRDVPEGKRVSCWEGVAVIPD